MIWPFVFGIVLLVIAFIIFMVLFPSKKYMSDIYMQMYLEQKKTNKTLNNMSNAFFAKSRKHFKKGER